MGILESTRQNEPALFNQNQWQLRDATAERACVLSNYSNAELHVATIRLVGDERRQSVLIVKHLKEIDRRRMWAEMAYASLFDYCTKALLYSESQTYRRISALKLIQEIPSVEGHIIDGSLNLSTLAQAQSFFRREEKRTEMKTTSEEKRNLINKMCGKTQKQIEYELACLSPSSAMPDLTQPISGSEVRIQFIASSDLVSKIERLRELLSHAMGLNASYEQLFSQVCGIALKKLDPIAARRSEEIDGVNANDRSDVSARRDAFSKRLNDASLTESVSARHSNPNGNRNVVDALEPAGATSAVRNLDQAVYPLANQAGNYAVNQSVMQALESCTTKAFSDLDGCAGDQSLARSKGSNGVPRLRAVVPAATRRQVWRRDRSECTYRDHTTGRKCGCRKGLQFDHIQPVALGGKNEIGNLRLLCWAHNQHAAIKSFGEEKMRNHSAKPK